MTFEDYQTVGAPDMNIGYRCDSRGCSIGILVFDDENTSTYERKCASNLNVEKNSQC